MPRLKRGRPAWPPDPCAACGVVTVLLETRRIGVVYLDRRRRILAANDRAWHRLRRGDGVADRDGVLCTRAPADQLRLDRLVAAALPGAGTAAVSGSMALRRSSVLLPLMVHVKLVRVPHPDAGARPVAALVLLVEPGSRSRIAPDMIAATLGLTPGESQVAVWLAEGRTVADMAKSTGHTRDAIYWHLKQTYQKLHIARQADLVRLVLSIAEWD